MLRKTTDTRDELVSPVVFFERGKYAITINTDDRHQYFEESDRLERFVNYVNEQVLHWPNYGINYKLYIELSEPLNNKPTKVVKDGKVVWYPGSVGPRLHLHGVIVFQSNKSVKRWLLHEQYRLGQSCSYSIKKLTDPIIWEQYCKKQQHIIGHEPLIGTRVRKPDLSPKE